jgi:hypothetical protein
VSPGILIVAVHETTVLSRPRCAFSPEYLVFSLHPIFQCVAIRSTAFLIKLIGATPDCSREFDPGVSFIRRLVLI